MNRLILTKDDVFLILSVLGILTYSIFTGRLSSDSINYLIMAIPGDASRLCMKNGELWGSYACGYSILIQLTSLIFNTDSFVSSKIHNALILFIHYCIFSYIFRSKRLALILTLLPFNVFISTYTWSENAILLSFSLYCLALFRIESKNSIDITSYALAFIAILIGCISRYAFAPFSVFIFLASFIIIQRKALLLLPVFILNGLIFIVYKYFTSLTDRERIAAPEDIILLIVLFSYYIEPYFKKLMLVFTPVIVSNIKNIRFYKLNEFLKPNWGMFFILLGVSYLGLSFILRAIIQYDLYNFRTVGFGGSLIASGILITYRSAISKSNFIVVVLCIALCQIFLNKTKPNEIISIINGNLFHKNAVNQFVKAQQNVRNNIIIPLGLTDGLKGGAISLFNLRYNDAIQQRIPGMPFYRPLNVADFHSLVLKGQKCRFFFSPDLTEKKLKETLSEKYLTGMGEYTDKFSPEMKEFVLRKFNTKDTDCY